MDTYPNRNSTKGKTVARRTINLCDYIGKGVVTQCLRIDDNKRTDHVYITFGVKVEDHSGSGGGNGSNTYYTAGSLDESDEDESLTLKYAQMNKNDIDSLFNSASSQSTGNSTFHRYCTVQQPYLEAMMEEESKE